MLPSENGGGYFKLMGLFSQTVAYEYCERLIKLQGQEDKIFKLVLDTKLIRDLIVFMNTADQLGRKHVDSTGEQLFNNLTNRTTYSIFNKKKGGKPYEVRDTGDYWRSFKATIGNGFIVIDSDPQKEDTNLFQMYTPELEGLTDENLERLIQIAHEFFVTWYIKNLLR